ncbi:translation initiation factor 2 [Streptomyces sp. PT12]|uniref:translation initiation factor 2 n=1 Tax=Streptomyces sp. PT12 TaxID=1510197 RepID=UPI000DE1D935|nr:translation initiation factor 2 [Streptomyces sp. PT12]RBM12660.1 translation initiation factor 2 [Streptomyces sp. PT12]
MKSWATGDGRRAVLFAARSATALNRLLDVLPVFAGDGRVERTFTLVPGSDFGLEAFAAVEKAGGRTIPWEEARRREHDVVLAASPKGQLRALRGPRVLLPHGAGFGKAISDEGTPQAASGLDPAYLAPGDRPLASLHALAHPSQVTRLASISAQAASRATVVGDPTLERILTSVSHRDRYRAALGTGARTLIALASTWGPESLLRRRPALPFDLAAHLPYDSFQLALILHPNERARLGTLDLVECLAPALEAGMLLAAPFEEWAAVLVAADAVVTDHGSTALYAAALDRPVIAAYDGGDELIPGSPMARLLASSPRLDSPTGLEAALAAHRPGAGREIARSAFAEQGNALERLRAELYELLGLDPPPAPVEPRPLPHPATPRTPAAFAVRVHVEGATVRVERLPAPTTSPAHHLAAEHGTAGERRARGSGLLYRRADQPPAAATHRSAWTVEGWTARVLDDYPGCRTAAVILSPAHCVARTRSGTPVSVRIEPRTENGRVLYADPAAVLSAVHAWLPGRHGLPADLTCVIGGRGFAVSLAAATADEGTREL